MNVEIITIKIPTTDYIKECVDYAKKECRAEKTDKWFLCMGQDNKFYLDYKPCVTNKKYWEVPLSASKIKKIIISKVVELMEETL